MLRCYRSLLLAALSLSAACTLQPKYDAPDPAIASAYPQGEGYEVAAGASDERSIASLAWRDVLPDARMQALVDTALRNNRDLRVAILNVAELRAELRLQSSALYPQLAGTIDRSRSRTPADLTRTGRVDESGSYSVGLSLDWEIDLFGKVRSLRAAAFEEYLASIHGRNAVVTLLISQVANQYLTLLACDELLEVTDRTLESAIRSYDLVKLQFDVGDGSELDLRQAETIVEQARANREAQVRARAQAQNGLMLLLGQPDLPIDDSAARLSDQHLIEDVPAGLPSELLARRPDILQAEALLRSANADIGAARAQFFPAIELTGTAGTASSALNGLFKAGSAAWSVAPSIVLPLFTGGANVADLDAAYVRRSIAAAQYQKAVQTAFREVADGLAARGTFNNQIASLERFVGAERRRLELAQLLYRNGDSSYLDVLTAQQELYDAQLLLVSTRLQKLTNLIDLYRALGVGWPNLGE